MIPMIAGVVIASLAVTAAAPEAPPRDGLDAVKERAGQAIEKRSTAIDEALRRVQENEVVTDAHRARLVAVLGDTQTGLAELGEQIAAASTRAELGDGPQSIATDYRVFAVVLPQTAYTLGADRLTEQAIPGLERAYAGLLEAAGDDSEALEALERMDDAIEEADALAEGLAEGVLAVTPADYNEDRSVMSEWRRRLANAHAAVREAVRAGREALRELR